MSDALTDVGRLLPGLARHALEALVQGVPPPHVSQGPPAPVFVTLRGPDGSLRGCVGSTQAVTASVTEETVRSATLAASRDPRFPGLTAAELPGVRVEVSVLMPAEAVASLDELAPARYGVIVRDARAQRQGLLLPNVPGIDDAATQVAIARRKAGIANDADIQLSRFEVMKFAEA